MVHVGIPEQAIRVKKETQYKNILLSACCFYNSIFLKAATYGFIQRSNVKITHFQLQKVIHILSCLICANLNVFELTLISLQCFFL